MAIEFGTLLLLDLVVAVPCVAYYYHWGVSVPAKKSASPKDIISHVKNAYIFTGIAMIYIPLLLLYYLYANLLSQFPNLFLQTSLVMVILILVFEYVNYYSYLHYERHRIK